MKKRKRHVERAASGSDLEVKELSARAVKYGYWSFLFGPLLLPSTLYFWILCERAAGDSRWGRKARSKAREGRNVAVFASIVWILILWIQFAGG